MKMYKEEMEKLLTQALKLKEMMFAGSLPSEPKLPDPPLPSSSLLKIETKIALNSKQLEFIRSSLDNCTGLRLLFRAS